MIIKWYLTNIKSKLIKNNHIKESRDFSQQPEHVPSLMIPTKMPSAKKIELLGKYFLQFGMCMF